MFAQKSPANFIVSILFYFQPTSAEWNNPNNSIFNGVDALKKLAGEDPLSMKNLILKGENKAFVESDLIRLFDSLPACDYTILIGRSWEGKVIRTNKNLLDIAELLVLGPLKRVLKITWGRRFLGKHRADPLVLNLWNRIYIPLPFWGNLSAETISWREVSTGASRYNHLPWIDYFKVLKEEGNDITLLGVWTSREKTGGFFTLTLDKSAPLPSTAPYS